MSIPSLRIRSAQGDYPVEFPRELETAVRQVHAIPRAALVIDRRIAELYATPLAPLLDGKPPALLLDATEEEKQLTTGVAKTVDWMQKQGCTKQSTLVAIGGGIIQDICTFSAHIYYRGIPWVFVPTTLLSMSDSCIGAKCGINLNSFKNQLGVFQSPSQVLICTRFIETLSDPDVASGYGEILKLLLTGSREQYELLKRTVSEQGLRNSSLDRLIYESLAVKKRVIEEDEYEKDLRRILNYGHTFGHSLEAITDHEVPHGLAVAWGLDLINFLAVRRGLLEREVFEDVHAFIRRHLPFRRSRRVSAAELIDGARKDKKVADGQVNLAVMERPGSLKIVKTPFDAALNGHITEYLEEYDVFADRH